MRPFWRNAIMSLALALGLATEANAGDLLSGLDSEMADLGLSTSLRAGYWSSNRVVDDRRNYVPASAWVRGRQTLGTGTRLVGEGWVQSEDLSRGKGPTFELREGYLRQTFGDWDVRIGRQLAVWGRADRINPTDNLGSRNLTWLFHDDDDLRRGSGMVRVAHPLGESMNLQAYWIPEFRPNVTPIAQQIGPFVIGDDRRPTDLRQGAVRLDSSADGFDWSLSYFDGVDRNGDLVATGVRGGQILLQREYQRQRTVGADAATVLLDLNLRAEIAYTDFPDRGPNDLGQRPFMLAVIGGDKQFLEDFNLNLQWIFRRVSDHASPEEQPDPVARGIALINAVQSGQRDEIQNGASMRLAFAPSDNVVRAEIFAIQDFTHGDGIVRAKVSYALTDDLRATAGYDWSHGHSDALFGALRPNNAFYVELRRGF
jgi:hypothetical protein